MEELSSVQEDIYYGGSSHRPAEAQVMQAGPLRCTYESGYLRYFKIGNMEVLRMIYPAVRDHNWGTVSPQIRNEQLKQKDGGFEIQYDCRYQEGEIDFQVHYYLSGDHEGNIYLEMQGEALSTFRKNRIGFNILHPPEAAETDCIITHTDGKEEWENFPKYISPHQPFKDIKSMRWKMNALWLQIDFEGDIFEMEDQRNWTDASFKTYSTPLGLPFPVTVHKGDKIHQKIHLSVENAVPESYEEPKQIVFSLLDEKYNLPNIGIGQSSEFDELAEADLKYLKRIHFSHYRADVQLDKQEAEQEWERVCQESYQLDLPLELALHFSEDHVDEELRQLVSWIERDRPVIKQLLIFSMGHKYTSSEVLKKCLPKLRILLPKVRIGAGTDFFFTELNRNRIPTEGLDFLTYSLNPQVHQFDNQSLVETLQAQAFTVASAQAFSNGLPIHISPVTLKMRSNPNATGPADEVQPGELPPQVDTRQYSLFGACWTVGSLKYLIESKLSSVTYFETLGQRGIMYGAHAGNPAKDFRVEKDMLYPLYWVFYCLLQYKDVKVIGTKSSDPLQMDGIAWKANGELMMLLTNFQAKTLDIELEGWKDEYEIKMLDADHYEKATKAMDDFIALPWKKIEKSPKIPPYALCLIK